MPIKCGMMREQNPFKQGALPAGGLWRSRAGVGFIAFAAVAALLLGYEHRVHLFTGNGLLVVLLVLCIGIHFIMHRGHGGHGGGGRGQGGGDNP